MKSWLMIGLALSVAGCGGGGGGGGGGDDGDASMTINSASVENMATGERSTLAMGGTDQALLFRWQVDFASPTGEYTMDVFIGDDDDAYVKQVIAATCSDSGDCGVVVEKSCAIMNNSLLCGTTTSPRTVHIGREYSRFTFKACAKKTTDPYQDCEDWDDECENENEAMKLCREVAVSATLQPEISFSDYSSPEAVLRLPTPGNAKVGAALLPPPPPDDPSENPDQPGL